MLCAVESRPSFAKRLIRATRRPEIYQAAICIASFGAAIVHESYGDTFSRNIDLFTYIAGMTWNNEIRNAVKNEFRQLIHRQRVNSHT